VDEPARLAARRTTLEARARILRAVRAWFDAQGFVEVETPARVPSPGQEVHLDAIAASEGRWLVTSPEYHMKRLVAAGYSRIVQIGKAWRAGERGAHHQPEFTLIEWYRAGAPLERIAADCEEVVRVAADAAGHGAAALSLAAPFARTTVREALQRHAGIALDGGESAADLRDKARAAGAFVGSAEAWDDVFFQIFLERVEPALARSGPTFVFDWPAELGALARRKPSDPRFVERFELYAGGLELANAFGELTDAAEQRARFEEESRVRAARGKAVYPVDERLLAALPHMPPTAGVALGFDRLVMLVLGQGDIRQVVAFADDEL
jgi:elongation factor P--(R)-beta-lysine ligase